MKKNKGHRAIVILSLVAVMALFAGCAGSGGGVAGVGSGKGSLLVTAEVNKAGGASRVAPRAAAASTGYDQAIIVVFDYDAFASWTLKAFTWTTLAYDSANNEYVGSFLVSDVPTGINNLTCEVFVHSSSVAQDTFEDITATPTAVVSSVVPYVLYDYPTPVTVDERTTIASVAALRYSQLQSPTVALSSISSSKIDKIKTAVDDLYTAGTLTSDIAADYFTHTGFRPLDKDNWDENATMTTMISYADQVVSQADLMGDTTAPQVSKFMIGTTDVATSTTQATGVAYDGTVFSVVFDESMDSTTDLNDSTTLSASGFTISLQRSDTGGTLTIDSTNALSYGTFAWTTVTNTNDTLTYTLKSNATLEAASLKTLKPGKTYDITTWTAPSNLKDTSGNSASTTDLSATGSFVTSDDTTAPTGPTYVYDGTGADEDITTSTTTLSANWDAATDAESGVSAYYYAIGTTSGASDTVTWTSTTGTSVTKTGLSLTASATYYFSVKAQNGAGLFGSVVSSDGITVSDTTAPTAISKTPDTGATGVAYDGTQFIIEFDESMDTAVTLSGYSMTIENSTTGGSLVINDTNVSSYGAFAWSQTTVSNDTLTFTLNSNATLLGGSFKVLRPNTLYNITTWTAPTNLQDVAGNALDTSADPTTGSFTTVDLTVSSFDPVSGATGVAYDGTAFKVIFTSTMDSTIDMNNQTTLTDSGFSVSLERVDTGGTLTINTTNALSYGTFSWATTTVTDDTLVFTLLANSVLTGAGLKTLKASTSYNITSRTVPTNLKDTSSNPVNTTTGIAQTGTFTTGS